MSKLGLEMFSDTSVVEEAARRLQKKFFELNGVTFLYGRFEFVIHNGKFRGVDERPFFKSFYTPSHSDHLRSN